MPNWYTINHPTTLQTHNETSDPLLLADGTLRCGMYPAGQVAISQHLATPGFPQCDQMSESNVQCQSPFSLGFLCKGGLFIL